MKLRFLPLFIILFSLSLFAQSPSKVLKQAEKALGGAKNLQSINSWVKTGTITRQKDGVNGKFQMQTAQPNLYRIAYDLDGFETEMGYSGRSGWTRDSRNGLSTLTDQASRDFPAEAAFRNSLWLNYKKDKSRIASAGVAKIEGKSANVLVLTTIKGIAIKIYFDAATGLPLREEIPGGSQVKTFDYSDYRSEGGINHPFSIKLTTGGEVFDIKIDKISKNPAIAKSDFDFPVVSGEPLPDIPALLAELQSNEDRVDKILDTYSFTQKYITREVVRDGSLRETGSETYQLSFYNGKRVRRLIEKNGVPLNAKEQADEDKDLAKRLEDLEKREEAQKSGAPDTENRKVSISELLRASNLVNPRRERFRGRDVIVFDFEPNPTFDYKNSKSILKFFGKTAGVMWVDEKDKQVARLEAMLADSFKIGGGVLAKMHKGASFTLDQERVNDEIWLPAQTDINISVRVLLVKGVNVNQLIKSYDYRKFATEVKDAKVGDDVKKP